MCAPVDMRASNHLPTSTDYKKFGEQLRAVYDAMSSPRGDYWTVPMLAMRVSQMTGKPASSTSISARIRDLRKPQYGGHHVVRYRDPSNVFSFALMPETD